MAAVEESHNEVLFLIQSTYVPFLKKLIAHLEKKKDTQPKSYDKLKYVYKTFCESDSKEKIEVYEACKDMLERWHKRYKDTRAQGGDKKSSFDPNVGSEDSQSDTSLSSVRVESRKQSTNTSASPSIASGNKAQGPQKSNKKKAYSAQSDGVYFKDEIEIESSDSSSNVNPSLTGETKPEKWTPIVNIKKEKDPIVTTSSSPLQGTPTYSKTSPPNSTSAPAVSATATPPAKVAENKEIVFVCASCQFRTTNEADFMKHARTDHRTDLSLWCKQCGKCFSNAGVLVTHIKENNCQKEDMIYRCGVKDCTFETPSGQTFVHHLRHCHKGSPFIFCIHCQKIFTLPHCLILHMQNECPFKEKNRRSGSSATPVVAAPSNPLPSSAPVVTKPSPKPLVPSSTFITKSTLPVSETPPPSTSVRSSAKKSTGSRGRGRGRGRGGRNRYSDSSDSDDPDDPSWRPEESLNNQPLRRSARWAKKVIDAKEPDLQDSENSGDKQKKAERPSKTFFYCPCCEFSALFKSLLEDHYVTDHKHPKKNSCNVCNVKFESKQYFLDHFNIHEKEKAEGKSAGNVTASEQQQPQPPTDSHAAVPATDVPQSETTVQMEIVPQAETRVQNSANSPVIIPYQTAIQEKLQKESKLKSFDDLKSANDIQKMKTETKLQHFFKCVIYNCTFTTDDNLFYVNHLNEHHKGKKYHCAYCLDDYVDAKVLTDHMLKDHGRRCYQCSLCFYRGSSKPHVQIHMKNMHTGEKASVFKCSQHLPPGYNFKCDKEEESDVTTTYPYICAIGDCTFKTYDPKEFKRHNDIIHRSVSVFFCHYCKVDFISFKRLMSHYHLHGINNFQCTYCVHGSDTKEEILVHLCNNHADKPFKVHVRTPQDSNASVKKSNSDSSSAQTSSALDIPKADKSDNDLLQNGNVYKDSTYPLEIPCLGKDVFCKLGFCGELLGDINTYVKHLIEEHCALNFLCPYCYFAADEVSDFENHLACHGPQLFACGEENCLYFSHEESDVALHMVNTSHHHNSSTPKVIRKKGGCASPKTLVAESALSQRQVCSSTGYICPYCCYRCSKQAMMKNHLYVELVYKRFQCNLCKIKCHSRWEAKQHFKASHSHHNIKCAIDGNATVECFVSHLLGSKVQKFITKGLGMEKEDWTKKSGLPSCTCINCSLSLPTTVELHHHMVGCLSHDYRPYICNHCGTKTMDLIQMKCHTHDLHPGGQIKYAVFPNKLLEEQHGRKLQDLRLNFLKELVLSVVDQSCMGEPKLIPKHYKCAYCKFVDTFRSNIEKHCLGCHKNKAVKVEKMKGNSAKDDSAADSPKQCDLNSDSSLDSEAMDTSTSEYYLCVHCTTKALTLAKLDEHVASHHSLPEDGIYPYIYCPDPNRQFSPNDSELYECAYCSVSQENLYHLQRHCNNLHSAAAFHVRGHKTKSGEMLKCELCECKVVSQELLVKHYQFNHPSKMPPKPSFNASTSKRKAATDGRDSQESIKRPKCVPETYHCSYCKEESDMILKITAHCESAHPNLPVKYKTVMKSDSSCDNMCSCDFCSFVGSKELLKKHISQKHKSCVCCAYCNKYLVSMDSLVLHTSSEHKGLLPKKTSDSGLEDSSSDSENEGKNENVAKKSDPVDLSALTVHLKHDATSVDAKLPVVYLAEMFPIFPKVVLQDFKKSK